MVNNKIAGYTLAIKNTYNNSLEIRARYYKTKFFDISNNIKINNKKYLDIGCGKCYNTKQFGKGFKYVYGIEYNKKELKNIRDINSNFKISHGDVQDLEFKNNFFNFITAISVLEHVNNLNIALKEMKRVLKKDGVLLIQIPNRYFLVELHTYLPFLYILPSKIREQILEYFGYSKDAISASKLSKDKLIKLIEKQGFIIERIEKLIYPIEIIPQKFRQLYKILKSFGVFNILPFGYFIICKK